MFNDQLLYKEIKNYKNLENHWIGGKIKEDNKGVLNQKYIVLEFCSTKTNRNSFRISHKLINQNLLFKRELISYDTNLKRIMHEGFIDVWYNNSNEINLGTPLQHIYFKETFIKNKYKKNKNLFFNMERKKNLLSLLQNNKLKFFDYLNIWNKVYKFNYNKNILKVFLIKFIQKQNMLHIKKNIEKDNIYIKSIFLGFYKKGFIMYSPSLLKVFLIPNYFLNKNIKNLLKKKKKRKLDWMLLYSVLLKYNIFYKIDIKYYKKNSF